MKDTSRIPEYITAICPPDDLVEQVRQLKQFLYDQIGWFSARNAAAHITFHPFDMGEGELQQRKEEIKAYAEKQEIVTLKFNSFSSFPESRTIFLAPDEESRKLLRKLFTNYREVIKDELALKEFHPHITVGKGINPKEFAKAKRLFDDKRVSMTFVCDNIALRKFNVTRQQYDIIDRFHFKRQQFSLF